MIPMKKLNSLVSLLCVAALPVLLRADTVVEEIIARVNNSIITHSDYARSREQLRDEIKQQDPGNADKAFAEKERDVLRDLIDQQLLLEKGKDLEIKIGVSEPFTIGAQTRDKMRRFVKAVRSGAY